jgi:hypothetical protein
LSGFEQLGILVSQHTAVPPGRFERGSVLARAEVPLGRPEVHVYLRATYDVAFDRDGPAGGTNNGLLGAAIMETTPVASWAREHHLLDLWL